MPPPKKVDLLPEEQVKWLKDALEASGFAGYEQIAEDLNLRLEAEGMSLRIGKSAVHNFGKGHQKFIRAQEQCSAWAAEWVNDNSLEEEAKRHNALFQMVTSLAFRSMQDKIEKDDGEIDPKELHYIGRLMKDVMSSSGIREKLLADERARIIKEANAKAAEQGAKAAREAGMSDETAEAIKASILGVDRDAA